MQYIKNRCHEHEGEFKWFGDTGEERAVKFIDALGGADNLKTVDACITRLRLTLADRSKIDEAQLKSLGSKGNVKLGNDGLQVILGPEAEFVAEAIKGQLK